MVKGSRFVSRLLAGAAVVTVVAFGEAASAAAATWCGNPAAPPYDRKPDLEISSPNQVHVLYAVPSDAPDRYAEWAPIIANDVEAVDAWWRRHDATRAPRFDRFPFPNCVSRAGKLDVGFIRLAHPAVGYFNDDRIASLVKDLGPATATAKKTLVYYDGPVARGNNCGISSHLAPRHGGQYGLTFVWTQACTADHIAPGFRAATAAHELLHNMGAVPQGAPRACAGTPAHACDSADDILSPIGRLGATLDNLVLDVGSDDYYRHAGSWWDVQDSSWLIRLPQVSLALTVTGTGETSGSVSILGTGYSCAAECALDVDAGTRVALVPHANSGARFAQWSGDCTGTAACLLTVDGAKNVSATFGPATYMVNVRVTRGGIVTGSPSAIACPGRCSAPADAGEPLRLRARPRAGFRFVRWGGACRGTRPACTVDVARALTVSAIFGRR